MMQTMELSAPGSIVPTYPLFIGSGILPQISEAIPKAFASYHPFLITDANLLKHGHAARMNVDPASMFIIDPPGESSKHIETVAKILNALDEKGFGRDTIILALGGGTVGDIAGFAASVFKRGVPVLQIPTTTVAQADSAIGGKTGVNSDGSKNAIGTFWNPCAILVDVDTLKTLDERHYVAGLAESLKHALIADASYLDWIQENVEAIKCREPKALLALAQRNAFIKGTIVERDPYERSGLRFVLNFGHTIGHAIETASDFRILHGEAVALGMLGALSLGAMMKVTPEPLTERTARLLRALGLPDALPEALSADDLVGVMAKDKKNVEGRIRFVLLSDIGDIYAPENAFAHPVERSMIVDACSTLK